MIAALPAAAVLVPGRSLAGVRLGDTAAQVRRHLGTDYGVCRGCATTTWYFTYRRFDDKGLAVELTRGRVSAVFTLSQPDGWHSTTGVKLGDPQEQVGPALTVTCRGYSALVRGSTAYFVVDGNIWGFALFRPRASPCR